MTIASCLRLSLLFTITCLAFVARADESACNPAPDGSGWDCADAVTPAGSAGPAAPASPIRATRRTPAETDWVPRDELPAEAARVLPPYCDGTYVEPSYPQPLAADSSLAPMKARGRSLEYWIDEKLVLSGDVRITQGNRSLVTGDATLDVETQRAVVDTGALLREPGFAVRGQRLEADLETGAAKVANADFLLHVNHLRGSAAEIGQDEAGTFSMTRGYFTRCEPGDETWRLSSSSVRIEKGAVFGTARDAVLSVHGVPVFYSPYIEFPVTDERVSGFLLPDIGYSNDYGVDVGVPYYFNLAPNYDATVTSRYIAERGAGVEAEFRHLGSWAENAVGAAFLYDDDLYDGTFERDDFEQLNIPGGFQTENRWLLSLDHEGSTRGIRTQVDYAAVSDVDYFGDLGTDLSIASQVDLQRLGTVEWADESTLVRLWAQRFQSLDRTRPEPYERLPEVVLQHEDALGPFTYSLGTSWSSFDRDDDFTGIARIVGQRTHLEPRVALPWVAPWGFLTMRTGFRYTLYDLDKVPGGIDDTPEREIWVGSVDGGLVFERELTAFGRGLVQTLEPRVYYLYQEFVDQSAFPNFDSSPLTFAYTQLFRENRFSGLDRIGDANQTSVGLTTRFLDARDGRELFRASAGEIIYFDDRRVTAADAPTEADLQSRSSWAGEVAAALPGRLSLRGNVVWDPHEDEVDELGLIVSYAPDGRHLFNFGYRSVRDLSPQVDQSDVSFYWPVASHWSLIGRWNYDLEQQRSIESFAGIEYGDCCWQIRVLGRRFLKDPAVRIEQDLEVDTGVFLQVVFRGLAGVGNKVDSVMENGIRGFRPEISHEH